MGFFDPVLTWGDRVLKYCSGVIKLWWDWIKYGYVWIVGIIYAFLVITDRIVHMVGDNIKKLAEMFGTLSFSAETVAPQATVGAKELLQIANTFYPVEETFTLVGAAAILTMGALLYRFIKSWVPGGFG